MTDPYLCLAQEASYTQGWRSEPRPDREDLRKFWMLGPDDRLRVQRAERLRERLIEQGRYAA